MFLLAKKRGVGKTERGKGAGGMAVTDIGGVVLTVSAQSAKPYKIILRETMLAEGFVSELPERLISDRGFDSDPLDEQLTWMQEHCATLENN